MTSLSLYRAEDEALLGLLDAFESTQPGTQERATADVAIAQYLTSQPARARVDIICSVWAGLDATLSGMEAQAMVLRQKKARIEEALDRIKKQTAATMAALGVKRTTGTAQSLVLHDCPEAVDIHNEAMIPDEYKTIHVTLNAAHWTDICAFLQDTGNDHLLAEITTSTPAPRKSMIKTVIKEGGGVPGASLSQAVTVVRR